MDDALQKHKASEKFLKSDDVNKIRKDVLGNKISKNVGRERIYKLARERGIEIQKCKPWESEYIVPKGNWLHNKENSCGKGCLCVDVGADRQALNKINSLKSFRMEQVCDGSKKHKPRMNTTPFIAGSYISKKPMNIVSLRKACSTSKQIIVDHYGKQRIENLCTNKKLSVKDTTALTKREKAYYKGQKDMWGKMIVVGKHPSIMIFGKGQNNKRFWKNAASALSGL